MALLNGAWAARLAHAAAELGIADHLADEPRDATFLATATKAHAPSLARLLRALTAIGVLHETERPSLHPHTHSARRCAATRRDRCGPGRCWFQRRPGQSLGTRCPMPSAPASTPTPRLWRDLWTRLAARPTPPDSSTRAMQMSEPRGSTGALITHYPFENYGWVVDVGGGNGALLLPVAARHPTMRVTVFDLPHVAERARLRIAELGLSDRCEAVGGDAFVSVPPGAAAYVLKSVIHDWEGQGSHRDTSHLPRRHAGRLQAIVDRAHPPRADRSARSAHANEVLERHQYVPQSRRDASAPRRSSATCSPARACGLHA